MKKSKNKKIRVGIIFGGRSSEHEVSLQSAKSIIFALDKNKYEPVLIGIDKKGSWHLQDNSHFLLHSDNPKLIRLEASTIDIQLFPGATKVLAVSNTSVQPIVDVVFPVLHGTNGEDGTMQGLLEILNVPYVGAGVLGSAVGMDKDVSKRLLQAAGLPVTKFLAITHPSQISFTVVKKQLGLPVFVKPANNGSSVGVTKAHNQKEFGRAITEAFQYDSKVLIEAFVDGGEIEVSVLGNDEPKASVPGMIIPNHEFYSYEAKYIDEQGAHMQIPAQLPKTLVAQIQQLAVAAYQTLSLEGMARVDLFLTTRNKIIINEVNTIPGFTSISMYPKLWEASGLSYPKLLDTLIALAIQRHERKKKRKTNL